MVMIDWHPVPWEEAFHLPMPPRRKPVEHSFSAGREESPPASRKEMGRASKVLPTPVSFLPMVLGSGILLVPRRVIGHYYNCLTSFTKRFTASLALPNSIMVFSLKNSSFSTPENPALIPRLITTVCLARSTSRMGMP